MKYAPKNGFRAVAWLEALSFIALLGIAMPLKYLYAMPEATRVPGLLHGLLFVAYLVFAHQLAAKERWPRRKLLYAYVASVLPFGTLVFDHRFMRASKSTRRA